MKFLTHGFAVTVLMIGSFMTEGAQAYWTDNSIDVAVDTNVAAETQQSPQSKSKRSKKQRRALPPGCSTFVGGKNSFTQELRQQKIVEIQTEGSPSEGAVLIAETTVEGDLVNLIMKSNNGYTAPPFSLSQVNCGAVLKKDDAHNLNVITLTGHNVSAKDGGLATLTYLYDGTPIFGSGPREMQLSIQRQGAKWQLYVVERGNNLKAINVLNAVKNYTLGTVCGIKYISYWLDPSRS